MSTCNSKNKSEISLTKIKVHEYMIKEKTEDTFTVEWQRYKEMLINTENNSKW